MSLGFIEALRDKVRIVTGAPHKVEPDGVVLEDGRVVRANTIVLATGFQLEYFKFRVELDGQEADMYDMILRRDVFFEGVPNFFQMVLFARLDSKNYTCFTPLVEHAVDFCTDLVRHCAQRGLATVQIVPLPPNTRPTERYMPLSSGYFARNRHKCFKAPPDEAASQGRVWNILFGYTFRPQDFLFG